MRLLTPNQEAVVRFVVPIAVLGVVTFLLPTTLFAQNGLPHRVGELEVQVDALTQQLATLNAQVISLSQGVRFIDVHCQNGETIQAALSQVPFRPLHVTINVFGVCTENVNITRSNVHIRGAAAGAGIQAANATLPVVRSYNPPNGNQYLRLSRLTLTGGEDGVAVGFATYVQIEDCTISGNDGTGVGISQGVTARIANTVIENNNGGAIGASGGSRLVVSGGIMRNNQQNGVGIGGGSSAEINGGAVISGSGADGISVSGGSALSFGPATSSGNGQNPGLYAGINVGSGSVVSLNGGAVIDGNRGNGIMATATGVIQKGRGETNVHVTNNTNWGYACGPSPAVAMLVGYGAFEGTVTGNGSGAINCPKSTPPPQ